MALLPYRLRPSVVIRRKAIWSGLLGRSTFWRIIGIGVFGQSTIKKVFGKTPESLGTFAVGADSFLTVINATPMTKKQRTRAGVTKAAIVAQAVADVRSARPGAGVRVKT